MTRAQPAKITRTADDLRQALDNGISGLQLVSNIKRGKDDGWKASQLIRLLASFGLGALDLSASHRCIRSLSARMVTLWRNLLSTGLEGMMHFVQGSGLQSPPMATLSFL
jgi:hypothetical protein